MVNFTSSAVNKQCWLKKGIGCLKNKLQLLLSLLYTLMMKLVILQYSNLLPTSNVFEMSA